MAGIGVGKVGYVIGEPSALLGHTVGPLLPPNITDESIKAFQESTLPRAEITSLDGKPACEDHTLTALLPTQDDKVKIGFAALADGISTKMFHAERGSALACLAAFSLCKDLVCDVQHSQKIKELCLNKDKVGLAQFLLPLLDAKWKQLVEQDLLQVKDALPVGWSDRAYETAKGRSDVHSHGTTLLFAYHDGQSGFVMKIGDGGVVGIADDNTMRVASGFDTKASDAVSSYLVAEQNKPMIKGGAEIHFFGPKESIVLMSDGPEETLAGTPILGETAVAMARSQSRQQSTDILTRLASRPGAKTDDYSFAIARAER